MIKNSFFYIFSRENHKYMAAPCEFANINDAHLFKCSYKDS